MFFSFFLLFLFSLSSCGFLAFEPGRRYLSQSLGGQSESDEEAVAKTTKYRAGVEHWIGALTCAVLGFWLSSSAFNEIFAASFHRVLHAGLLAASVAVIVVAVGVALGCFFLYIAFIVLIAQKSHKGVLRSVEFDKARAVLHVDATDIRIRTDERLRRFLEAPGVIGKQVKVRVGGPVVLLLEIERNS